MRFAGRRRYLVSLVGGGVLWRPDQWGRIVSDPQAESPASLAARSTCLTRGVMFWPFWKTFFDGIRTIVRGSICAPQQRRPTEEAARLQAALDAAGVAILTLDAEGRIESVNRPGLEMFGCEREQLVGETLSTLLGEAPAARSGFTPADAPPLEIVARRKTGESFRATLTFRDTTAGEERIRVVRMIDLTKNRGRRDEAEHRGSVDFVSEAGEALLHEINQPLAATATYLNVARRLVAKSAQPNEDVASVLARASAQTLRASGLVAMLRDVLHHADTGKTTFGLHEKIEEAVGELHASGAFGHFETDLSLHAPSDAITADRVRIMLALRNILREALSAISPTNDRGLSIRTANPDSLTLRVDIAETGALEPDSASLAFPDAPAEEMTKSLGSSLLLSASVIEEHNGSFSRHCDRSGRHLFRFTLPLGASDTTS